MSVGHFYTKWSCRRSQVLCTDELRNLLIYMCKRLVIQLFTIFQVPFFVVSVFQLVWLLDEVHNVVLHFLSVSGWEKVDMGFPKYSQSKSKIEDGIVLAWWRDHERPIAMQQAKRYVRSLVFMQVCDCNLIYEEVTKHCLSAKLKLHFEMASWETLHVTSVSFFEPIGRRVIGEDVFILIVYWFYSFLFWHHVMVQNHFDSIWLLGLLS